MYRIEFSDKSYMIVESDFNIVLFEKKSLKAIYQTTIEDFFNNTKKYIGFVVCDKVNAKLIPLMINVIKVDSYSGPINQRIKKVEDIKVGDLIMGPDGTPREVLELHRGQEEMFEIETEDGDKHIVNKGHNLQLLDIETGEQLDMPVEIYIQTTDEYKEKVRMIKVGDKL